MNLQEKQNEAIGIFDSGIGGVTVLKEILKELPYEKYIYYSDSVNNPYGDKSQEEIQKICCNIVEYFLKRNCKAIVIACNTASAKAVEFLREKFKEIPIIAIEPAYKMVYDYAFNKDTLVMATKRTIESNKFNNLLKNYNNNKTYLLPCIGLADAIEEADKEKIQEFMKKELAKYAGKVQNVVIGCTHYALIKEEIKNTLGNVQFFYGAKNLALHLKDELQKNGLIKNVNESKRVKIKIKHLKISEKYIAKNKISENLYKNIEFIDSSKNQYKKTRFFEFLSQNTNF